MAGVFKSIDKSDIRLTPFRAYKLVSLTGSFLSSSIYQADYNPYSYFHNQDPLNDTFDQGNLALTLTEPTTSNGYYQRVVHRSLDHLYYRDFYTNTRATFGGGNINYQYRFLEDRAKAISIPQSKFGEAIKQGSVKIAISFNGSNYTLVDDLYGNLVPSGGINLLGSTVSGSVSQQLVGEWPSDSVYKYLGEGLVTYTSEFNRGLYGMQSLHTNLLATRSAEVAPTSIADLIGTSYRFQPTSQSRIEAGAPDALEYHQFLNFENGDFTIAALVKPESNNTTPSGSVLITKAGRSQRLQLDINGNLFVEGVEQKTPYNLYYSASRFVFERNALYESARVVSSTKPVGSYYHVVALKTGSYLQLWIDGVQAGSQTDVTQSADCSNQSNIYVGNSWDNVRGFDGIIDSVKLYRGAFSPADIALSHKTQNVGNVCMGNVFYTNGMVVLSSNVAKYFTVNQVDFRATQTIYQTEISCTVNPGEFNRSVNRTLTRYNPNTNQYEFKGYCSGSEFKPYVTTIGLYNREHELVAIGKLSTPIQLPSNVDTTFIVRYDRW